MPVFMSFGEETGDLEDDADIRVSASSRLHHGETRNLCCPPPHKAYPTKLFRPYLHKDTIVLSL